MQVIYIILHNAAMDVIFRFIVWTTRNSSKIRTRVTSFFQAELLADFDIFTGVEHEEKDTMLSPSYKKTERQV